MPKTGVPSRELLYKVLATLYRYSEELAVLEHPKSIERRSVDLAVRLRGGRRILVKVAYDLDAIPRREVQELQALSYTLGVPALIVASVKSGEPLLEGVLYEKSGLPALSPETLDNVLSGREQVYIRVGKESFTVSIDGELMRRRRMEKNLSMGDLALMVGVSRRTIYEYEKGSMEPSIDKAEKLIKILGEDIARPIDIFEYEHPRIAPQKVKTYDTIAEKSVGEALEREGYRVAHVKRTVLDIAASREGEDIALVVEHPSRKSSLIDKAYYLERLARTVEISERYVLVESSKTARMLEKEGYNPVSVDEFIALLRRQREERGEG